MDMCSVRTARVLFPLRHTVFQPFFFALYFLPFLSVLHIVDGRPTPLGAKVQPIARDDGVLTTKLVTAYALESYATAVPAGTAISGSATTFVYMKPGAGKVPLIHFSTTTLTLPEARVAQSSIGFVEFYTSFRNDCLFTQIAGQDSEMVICQHIRQDGVIQYTFTKSPFPITTVEVAGLVATQTSSDKCAYLLFFFSPWELKIVFVSADCRAIPPLREYFQVFPYFPGLFMLSQHHTGIAWTTIWINSCHYSASHHCCSRFNLHAGLVDTAETLSNARPSEHVVHSSARDHSIHATSSLRRL
jgi:hypothetical protein